LAKENADRYSKEDHLLADTIMTISKHRALIIQQIDLQRECKQDGTSFYQPVIELLTCIMILLNSPSRKFLGQAAVCISTKFLHLSPVHAYIKDYDV
jgi:hypothetical protein